jgi:hypothetical protein
MEPHESDAFIDELDTLADVFNVVVDGRKKGAYWRALQDLPLDAVQHACLVVLREESFFPAPSIFRDAARQYLRDQRSRVRPLEDRSTEREDTMATREIRALMATVWPDTGEETPSDALP